MNKKPSVNLNKIKLVIIEDNELLRKGIRVMFKEQKDIQLLAALGGRVNVHDKIKNLKPDVLLLDFGLAAQDSLELVKTLKKKFPRLKIIGMDFLPIQSDIKQFIKEGVHGFILKDASIDDFMNSIRSVAKGNKIFPSQLKGTLFSEIVDKAVNELMDSKLVESISMTDNEKKIIKFISKGLTDDEIAKKLNMKLPIVKSNIDNILEKMSLNTRVQIDVYLNSGGDNLKSSNVKSTKSKKTK
jgi:two-component system, NarL family, nitrate/nitrite response regulator NarL